jgi:RNA polymerase sigma-70 factor (ECF subfamily)
MSEAARSLCAQGRSIWPEVDLDPSRLAEQLERLGAPAAAHVGDFYLASACAFGVAAAVSAFDRQFLARVPQLVARFDPSPAFGDDVKQQLAENLLVAPAGALPTIGDYAGRGPLGGWVRISAVRLAIELLRARGTVAAGDADDLAAVVSGPEARLLQSRYLAEYQAAVREALASLSPRERNLLRMSFLDGLSIDRIGGAYQVHRATAARWIQAALQKIAAEAYRLLGERLALTPIELESLCGVVASQLELTLSGLLAG